MEKGMIHRAAHGLVLVCALVASSLTFAYVLPGNAKGCGNGYAALVSAMSAAVMAFAGLVLIFTSHDKLNRYITAGASILMMVAVSFVYEMIYQGNKCRAPSDDGDMRQSVLVFATIHYAASILSIIVEREATTSILSLAGAGVSLMLAVAALVLQQIDGGVKTICSQQSEDDFEGVAIFVVVITALLLGGYYLSQEGLQDRWNTWRSSVLSGGGSGACIIVYFAFNLLIIDGGSSECQFLLQEDHKNNGRAAAHLIIAALALHHLIPLTQKRGGTIDLFNESSASLL